VARDVAILHLLARPSSENGLIDSLPWHMFSTHDL
jgi:hypothetical protein